MTDEAQTPNTDPLAAATARIAELETQLAQARAQTATTALGHALRSARIRPEAAQDAETLARAAIVATHGADGSVTGWRVGDDSYERPEDALSAFLKTRAYLVAPAEQAPKQTNEPTPRMPELQADSDVSYRELLRQGLSKPLTK